MRSTFASTGHVLVEVARVNDPGIEPGVHQGRLDLPHPVRGLLRVAVLVDLHRRVEHLRVDRLREDVGRGRGPEPQELLPVMIAHHRPIAGDHDLRHGTSLENSHIGWLGDDRPPFYVLLSARRDSSARSRTRCRGLIEVRLVVVPGEYPVERLPALLARFGAVARLSKGGVPLEEVHTNAIPMGRAPVPGARLLGESEGFLAEGADLGRRADPRDPPGRRVHGGN